MSRVRTRGICKAAEEKREIFSPLHNYGRKVNSRKGSFQGSAAVLRNLMYFTSFG